MTIKLINALKDDLFILERKGYDRIASDIHEAIKQLEQLTLYKNLADEYGLSVFDSVANLEERLSTTKTYYEQVMADGGDRIKALEEENAAIRSHHAEKDEVIEQLEKEADDAEQAPWEDWAEQILKIVRKHTGYDGFDDGNGIDLPEEVAEALSEYAAQITRLEKQLSESKSEAMKYKLATEKNAKALREAQRDAADMTKILAAQQMEHYKQLTESQSDAERYRWICQRDFEDGKYTDPFLEYKNMRDKRIDTARGVK